MSEPKPKYLLRIRSYPEGRFVDCWIIRRDGAASHSVLWGNLYPPLADELAAALGLPVEREHRPMAGATESELPAAHGCATVPQQKSLFAEEGAAP